MTDPKDKPASPVTQAVANANTVNSPAAEDLMKKLGFTSEQVQFIQQMTLTAALTAVNNFKETVKSTAPYNRNAAPQIIQQCEKCFQAVTACKGEHVKMVVYPDKYPEYAKWFAGVKINGYRYVSQHPGHAIFVPKCAVATINNSVKDFEENERTNYVKRVKEHHSGSIGRKGTGVVPATSAWR